MKILILPLLSIIGGNLLNYYFDLNVYYNLAFFLILNLFFLIRYSKSKLLIIFSIFSIFLSIYRGHLLLDHLQACQGQRALEIRTILKEDEDYSSYRAYDRTNKKAVKVNFIGERILNIGDRIIVDLEGKKLKVNRNPSNFSEERYGLGLGFYEKLNIESSDILSLEEDQSRFIKSRRKFEDYVSKIYKNSLSDRNESFVKAILLARSNILEEDLSLNLKDLGLSHMLAISGLHTGIIYGFIELILKTFRIKKNKRIFIGLAILWIYSYLISFPPSLVRACIIISLIEASFLLARPEDKIGFIGIAAIISLIINPYYIFNYSFILSYTAYTSIVYIGTRLRDQAKPLDIISKSFYYLGGLYLGMIPLQLYLFGQFNLLSLGANILLGPLFGIIVNLMFLGLIKVFTLPIGHVLDIFIDLYFKLVEVLSYIRGLEIKRGRISIFLLVFYYLGLFIYLNKDSFRYSFKNRASKILLVGIVIIFFSLNRPYRDDNLYIHMLDVGNGQCIYLNYRDDNYIIDTGGGGYKYSIPENISLPYLKSLGLKELDGLFISHFDQDHCEGTDLFMEEFKPRRFYSPYKNQAYNYENNKILRRGDRIRGKSGLEFYILHPKEIGEKENNNSLVILLKFRDSLVLFTGDIEREAEEEVAKLIKDLKIDIFTSPHHGSKTSSSQEFVSQLKSSVSLISAGVDNRYGHPAKETLEIYEKNNIKIYRTDRLGRILIKIGEDLEVDYYLKEKNILDSILIYRDFIYVELLALYGVLLVKKMEGFDYGL